MNLFTKLTAVAALSATVGLAVPGISHAAVGHQELSKGMQNKDVTQLQDILKDRGYLNHPDKKGSFGGTTAEAVKQYQENHHLNVDGIAGPNTFKVMDLKNSIGPELLSQGDQNYDVTVLQNKLKDLGFYKSKTDGKLGSKTEDAIKDFQSKKHLLVDGIAGPNTKAALHLKVIGNETAAKKTNKADYDNHKKVTANASASTSTSNTQQNSSAQNSSANSNQSTQQTAAAPSNVQGSTITVTSTAYTANCAGCTGRTATGQDLKANPNQKVIAVDPNVIPLGSKVYVPGYGVAIAGDTGGAIKGNRIDVFIPGQAQANSWGVKTLNVTILK